MNPERDIRDDEPKDSEFEATDKHQGSKPDQSSWLIRIIQFVLAAVLIGIVVHGLLTRLRERVAQMGTHGTTSLSGGERNENATTATHVSLSSTAARSPAASPRVVAAPDTCLRSLADVADYLELARVKRETRAYELGLTSREALVQLATSSEPSR